MITYCLENNLCHQTNYFILFLFVSSTCLFYMSQSMVIMILFGSHLRISPGKHRMGSFVPVLELKLISHWSVIPIDSDEFLIARENTWGRWSLYWSRFFFFNLRCRLLIFCCCIPYYRLWYRCKSRADLFIVDCCFFCAQVTIDVRQPKVFSTYFPDYY